MIRTQWPDRALSDLARVSRHWMSRNPEAQPAVLHEIYRRVQWLADDHYKAGMAVSGLSHKYRWIIDRTYGYKIFYRVEGDPPQVLRVITLRHSRERPLKASTLRRYVR